MDYKARIARIKETIAGLHEYREAKFRASLTMELYYMELLARLPTETHEVVCRLCFVVDGKHANTCPNNKCPECGYTFEYSTNNHNVTCSKLQR